MTRRRILLIAGGFATLFSGLVATVIYLVMMGSISFELGMLMLVALLGMYIGFGVLIAVYRLVHTLK